MMFRVLSREQIPLPFLTTVYHFHQIVCQTNCPEFEVCNGKKYLRPKHTFNFLIGHSDGRDLGSKSVLSTDTQRPLSVNLTNYRSKYQRNLKLATVKTSYAPKDRIFESVGKTCGQNGNPFFSSIYLMLTSFLPLIDLNLPFARLEISDLFLPSVHA